MIKAMLVLLKIALLNLLLRMARLGTGFHYLANQLLKVKNWSLLTTAPYSKGGQCLEPSLLAPCASASIPPRHYALPDETESIESEFPAINATHFQSALIHGASSAVISRERVFIPQYYFDRSSSVLCQGGHFLLASKRVAVVANSTVAKLSHGLPLIGCGASNWYHWLIEILPGAMLAERLPSQYRQYPFLVPEAWENCESYRDSLEVFCHDREVISLREDRQYWVGDLVMIDSPVNGPYNMRNGTWPMPSDYRQNSAVLREFRARIIENLGLGEKRPAGMYFLARGNGRRSYNQDEVAEIAKSRGFEIVYPERLSFREQVDLFYGALLLVGPSGGAWANSIFCQPGSMGLTWVFPEYKGFCAYSNLAMISGLDLKYIFSPAERHLASTGDAYACSYYIDPSEFSHALETVASKARHFS